MSSKSGSPGQPAKKCHAANFQEAAELYIEAKSQIAVQWRTYIERLCGVIGEYLLTDIRQHVLVDAANVLYRIALAATKNVQVFAPAAAVLHYAAENDLCPYTRVKKLKEKRPEPRAMRKDDAARLIAASTGKMRLLLFLFAQGWRIQRHIAAHVAGRRPERGEGRISY